MFNYKIGYSSYEDSHYVELSHETEYSKEQLQSLVFEAVKYFFNNLKEEDHYKYDKPYNINFSDIIDKIRDILINQFGFKKIEYNSHFDIFGWPKILVENDWEGQTGETLDKMREFLSSNGIKLYSDEEHEELRKLDFQEWRSILDEDKENG